MNGKLWGYATRGQPWGPGCQINIHEIRPTMVYPGQLQSRPSRIRFQKFPSLLWHPVVPKKKEPGSKKNATQFDKYFCIKMFPKIENFVSKNKNPWKFPEGVFAIWKNRFIIWETKMNIFVNQRFLFPFNGIFDYRNLAEKYQTMNSNIQIQMQCCYHGPSPAPPKNWKTNKHQRPYESSQFQKTQKS